MCQQLGVCICQFLFHKLIIFCSASAVQTIVQLMGEENILEYHGPEMYGKEWTLEIARDVLHTWQRAFVQVLSHLANHRPNAAISGAVVIESFLGCRLQFSCVCLVGIKLSILAASI